MDEAFDDARVDGWESLEQGVQLPDANDRHVVAAALRGRADLIITENIKDFPESALRPLGLEAVRVDDFLLDQLDLDPLRVQNLLTDQAEAMVNPPQSIDGLLKKLSRSGAPHFGRKARELFEDRRG